MRITKISAAQKRNRFDIPPGLRQVSIENINLETRTYNGLRNHNILFLGELDRLTYKEIISIKNFGLRSFNDLLEKIKYAEINGYGWGLDGAVPVELEWVCSECGTSDVHGTFTFHLNTHRVEDNLNEFWCCGCSTPCSVTLETKDRPKEIRDSIPSKKRKHG